MTPPAVRVIRRRVGLLPLVGLIYFSVSGGPFGLEEAVGSAGPGMALLMVAAIPLLFGLPCSLMAAELGSALPLEGGFYYWVKVALGRFAGYVEGLGSWLVTFLDTALYPVIFADYVAVWLPGAARGEHVVISAFDGGVSVDLHWLVAIVFKVPLAWLNARGARVVGGTSVGLMVAVLAPFLVVTVLGLVKLAGPDAVSPVSPFTLPDQAPSAAFGAALGVVIWNYIGWDAISTASDEIDHPRRTYPRALAISLPLITVSYLLPLVASLASGLHADDPSAWADGDFAEVGRLLGGHWLAVAVTLAAVLAQVGLFSSLLLSGSRTPEVLAADGYLPGRLARTSPRYGTPVTAIVTSCAVFAVFCALDFTTLVDSDVLLNLFLLLLEFAALIVLRVRFPLMRRPFRIPGGMPGVIAATAPVVVFTGWLLWSTVREEPLAAVIGTGMLVLAALSWWPVQALIKRGRPDAVVDVEGIDFGPGTDAGAIVYGQEVHR